MRIVLAGAVLVAVVLSASAQEHGRGALNIEGGTSGLGRTALPKPTEDLFFGGGNWGMKAGLGWALANWKLGDAEGSNGAFAPQASLFYKATDNLDVNISTLFFTAEDSDGEFGDNEADMVRFALGLRWWFDLGNRIVPYLGAGLGYYFVDGSTDNVRVDGAVVPAANIAVDNAPGAFLEAGVAFQMADAFFVNAEVNYDSLLGAADAEINGRSEDFNLSAFTIGLSVTCMF